jgi:hypothetical protein
VGCLALPVLIYRRVFMLPRPRTFVIEMTRVTREEGPPLKSVVRVQAFFEVGSSSTEAPEPRDGVLIALRLKARFTDTRITIRSVSAAPKVKKTSKTVAVGLLNKSDNQRCICHPIA